MLKTIIMQIRDAMTEYTKKTGKIPNRIYLGELQESSLYKLWGSSPNKMESVLGMEFFWVKEPDHLFVCEVES